MNAAFQRVAWGPTGVFVGRSIIHRVAWVCAVALSFGCGSGGVARHLTPNTQGWWRDRVVYEVFVRSFADSDGDGVGDLRGLTQRLDYLNDGDPTTHGDLGVGAVWLMPIFPSPSYHGYDVTDYRAVNPRYGTLDDFDAFVRAAHQRGIRVILDMVLNHSSSQHPWFVNSRSGPTAEKRDWYVWRTDNPGWGRPWDGANVWYPLGGYFYYAIFWSGMPDLNYTNAAVEAEMVDSMRFWLARGVDGFRIDAVRYLVETATGDMADTPATHALLRRMRAALQPDYPDMLLVGEAWTTIENTVGYYGQGDELQLAFSFVLADALVQAGRTGDATGVASVLGRLGSALAGKDRGFDAPFLTNHDQVRVMRALGGDAAAARVAAATLLALPGTPFLYYGEEIGMQGGASSADEDKRTPMRWNADGPGYGFTTGTPWRTAAEAAGVDVASQQADPASLWNLYRRLLEVRGARKALASGLDTQPAITGSAPGLLAVLRGAPGDRVLLVANFGTTAAGPFSVAATGTPNLLVFEGLSAPPEVTGGALQFPGLAPRGFAFVSLD